jgi:hypothetical protein
MFRKEPATATPRTYSTAPALDPSVRIGEPFLFPCLSLLTPTDRATSRTAESSALLRLVRRPGVSG